MYNSITSTNSIGLCSSAYSSMLHTLSSIASIDDWLRDLTSYGMSGYIPHGHSKWKQYQSGS